MTARALAALWICKLTRLLLKVLGRGGTSFPGKAALRICPVLPKLLAENIDITAVSGTNGKTTTCRMIYEGFKKAGANCILNRSGANLLPGITVLLSENAGLSGKPRAGCAVIECDELTAKAAIPMIAPKTVVLTNLYRDQLDRCGEITNVQNALRFAIEKVPNASLCINADDPLLCELVQDLPNPIHWYGSKGSFAEENISGQKDARYCFRCGSAYMYKHSTFAHLGAWYCPECGMSAPEKEITAMLLQEEEEGSPVILTLGDENVSVRLTLPGGYNVYNAAAAASALKCAGLSTEIICSALECSHAAFGRGENLDFGGGVKMMLIKNPAGCDRVLHYLKSVNKPFALALLLNDEAADGTDISWIWDSDFESLCTVQGLSLIYAGGKRKEEILVRLKYAGVDPAKIVLIHSMKELIKRVSKSEISTVVMPTYTAMMELRPLIVKAIGGKTFWE